MRVLWFTLGALGLVIVARMSVFTVDPTEFVYVTEWGAPVATYDGGARDSEAGLYLRWPWPVQSVQRLDRRLQHFDLPATELLTHDPRGKTIDKTLTVEAYVCWRILGKDEDASAVDRFIRRMGTAERARQILGQRLNSQLGALVGQMRMEDLISDKTDEGGIRKVDVTMKALQKKLIESLQTQARDSYGVELVDVRLRRFNHPAQVRESIFERIRSERTLKVEDYRSRGQREAEDIKSRAQEKVRVLLAEARAEEKRLKGKADTEADLIRTRAHSQDPEFFVFLKKLEKMQSILGENKTLLLLSTHRPIFDLLFQPPGPGTRPGMPPAVTGHPAGNGGTPAPAPRKGQPAGAPGGP
jgi:modulator of FtsH protease HflC